jgi:glycosyltransferase involved in cell wall biosynthesis
MKEDLLMQNENRRLKIAFLNTLILQDKRTSWKITNEYITQALQKHCGDITYIDTIYLRALLLGKIFNKSTQLLLKKTYMYYHSFFIAKRYGKIATQKLAGSDFDVIIAPSCATEIAYLETDIPIVLIEDANFALLHDYYAQYSNLLKRSFYEVDALESLALHKADLALYPSEWAARATCEHYAVDVEKVRTVPFGANVANPPSIEAVQRRKKSDRCKLFFIGVDWERKGGEIAFETLLKLEEMGIQAELIVCGCIPPERFSHARMTIIPFLSRKDEDQRRQLESLFETSDFLFLPTRGETYGMVFCEASSFGLPSITTDTGGVSGAVTNGENGYMLPPSARGEEYAELIARIYHDDQGYAKLVKTSRAAFENRLNWDAWGISVTKLIHEMLEKEKSRDNDDVPVETVQSI